MTWREKCASFGLFDECGHKRFFAASKGNFFETFFASFLATLSPYLNFETRIQSYDFLIYSYNASVVVG
jgi:hypothetical protein